MTEKKVGRPPWQITPAILERVEELASQGLWKQSIGPLVGLNPNVFIGKCSENPELNEAYNRGRVKGVAHATSKLKELVDEKNPRSIEFFLKARAKEFKDPIPQQSVTVNNAQVQLTQQITARSDHELLELAKQAMKYLEGKTESNERRQIEQGQTEEGN